MAAAPSRSVFFAHWPFSVPLVRVLPRSSAFPAMMLGSHLVVTHLLVKTSSKPAADNASASSRAALRKAARFWLTSWRIPSWTSKNSAGVHAAKARKRGCICSCSMASPMSMSCLRTLASRSSSTACSTKRPNNSVKSSSRPIRSSTRSTADSSSRAVSSSIEKSCSNCKSVAKPRTNPPTNLSSVITDNSP